MWVSFFRSYISKNTLSPRLVFFAYLFSLETKVLCDVRHRYDGGLFSLSNSTGSGLSESSSELIQLHQYTLGLTTSPSSNLKLRSNLSLFFFMTDGKRSFTYSTLTLRESFSRSEHALFRLIYNENTDLFIDTNETYLSYFGDAGLLKIGRFPLNFSRMFFFSPNNIFSPPTALDRLTSSKPGVDGVSYEMSLSNRMTLTAGTLAGWRIPDVSTTPNATGGSTDDSASDSPASSDPEKEPLKKTEFESELASAFLNINNSFVNGPVVDMLIAKYAFFTILGASIQSQALKKIGVRAEGNYRLSQEEFEKNSLDFAVGFETKPSRSTLVQSEYFYHGAGASDTNDYLQRQSTLRLNNGNYLGKHYVSFYAQKQIFSYMSIDSMSLLNILDFSLLETLSVIRTLNQNFEMMGRLSLPLLGEASSAEGLGSEFKLYPTTLSIELHASF